MEYLGKLTLLQHLKSQPKNKVPESEMISIFKSLLKAIDYLHSKHIVHRDIKLENIMMDTQNIIKIIDFGFSLRINDNTKVAMFCGTPKYMAPEIVAKKSYVPQPVDIWALGVIFYILVAGKFPYFGNEEKDLFMRIKKASYNIPEGISHRYLNLLKAFFTVKPEDRITTKEVLIFIQLVTRSQLACMRNQKFNSKFISLS